MPCNTLIPNSTIGCEWRTRVSFEQTGSGAAADHALPALEFADYDLLEELSRRDGGTAQSSGLRDRSRPERLVAIGYAMARNLNVSTVEYEITPKGRIALLLKAYGIWNTTFSNLEPHRSDVDGLWRMKVSTEGDPTTLLDIGSATKLAIQLRTIGADDLANWFERELDKTRRYALGERTTA